MRDGFGLVDGMACMAGMGAVLAAAGEKGCTEDADRPEAGKLF
ncbi:MAG: hypothetical protein AB7H77_04155 [Bdellovibrionales bacterium]